MAKFLFILLILIYSSNSINASNVTELFQKISHLEVFSPEHLLFVNESSIRLQLKGFDLSGNEVDLNSVPVDWKVKESENSVEPKKDSPLEIIPFCSSLSVYESNKDIDLLERRGLRGSLILVKPVSKGSVIIGAQIRSVESNMTIEAKPFKLTVVSNEADQKCFKDVKGFDEEKTELDCLSQFYETHQELAFDKIKNETSDLALKKDLIPSKEEDRRRELSQFLRKCQRAKKYAYGVGYVDKERSRYWRSLQIYSLALIMFTIFAASIALYLYPIKRLDVFCKYESKICFAVNCFDCEKCFNEPSVVKDWNEFVDEKEIDDYNSKTMEEMAKSIDKWRTYFPDIDFAQINWYKLQHVVCRSFWKIFVFVVSMLIVYLMFLMLWMSFIDETSLPSNIPEDCQY